MTSDEIEFFVSDEVSSEDGEWHTEEMGGEPRTRPPLVFNLTFSGTTGAAVMLLAGAAALPVVAAFQGVYTITQGDGGRTGQAFGADGWGRYRSDSGPEPLSSIHEIRYGIALVACAAVMALSAVALSTTLFAGPAGHAKARVRRVVAVGALTATAVLAGVTASMALHLQSLFDTVHAQFESFDGGFGGRQPTVDTDVGRCLWLTLAGVVAGLLATAAVYRVRHATTEG